jgi:subfamily B ATP-binding cassette protein MsbA
MNTHLQMTREWGTYFRLLTYVRPYVGRLLLGCAAGFLFAMANAGLVWAMKGSMGAVFGEQRLGWAALLLAVCFFPLIGLAWGVTDYFSNYLIKWVGYRVVRDLRDRVFQHLHELAVDYFTSSRTGELISRTTNDTMLVERAVSTIIVDLVKQPVTFISMIVWIFVLDVRLALISMALFPLCIVPVGVFGRKVRRYSRQAQERVADVVSVLQECLSGIRIVKAFGMEGYEIRRFMEQTHAFCGRVTRVAKAMAMVEPIMVFISTVAVSAVLVYVHLVEMTMDEFFAFVTALFLMYEPAKKLSRLHVNIQQTSAAAERIFEVLDTKSSVVDRPGARALSEAVSEIVFDHVSFAYGDSVVLDDVSFSVRAGERVALVGSSGAGKTTLVNLLPRFYDPTGGSVSVNGMDIRDLTLSSLRARIGLVTQETFLFNDTVAHNIGYGSDSVSIEAIQHAAMQAHADDFIRRMPEGYDTVIGERGIRMSGGQRQRLAIARAIMRNPPILILDEATSALDTESERMVQAALDELMAGRTVLAIAHRLSTIASCDRILVMDSGKLIEEGTHDELLRRGGTYKRLYDMQFG